MKNISILCMLLTVSIVFSQEQEKKSTENDINPFRIGLKIGVPNVINGNIEVVTPLFDNRFALFTDYSRFKINDDDAEVKVNFFELGTNIYFKNTGRGFYGSISFSKLKLDGRYEDAETIGGTVYEGIATGGVEIKTTNLKLGIKLGKKFYFRAEVGYGFGDIPQEILITGVETNTGMEVTDSVDISDIPGMTENGILIGNIGFGISF